jgi:hypothetical protein
MRKSEPQTPLLALLRCLTDDQRATLASDAGTKVSYLYSLATCQRSSCRADLAMRIAKASEAMCRRTGGASPIVSIEELATMCPVSS